MTRKVSNASFYGKNALETLYTMQQCSLGKEVKYHVVEQMFFLSGQKSILHPKQKDLFNYSRI